MVRAKTYNAICRSTSQSQQSVFPSQNTGKQMRYVQTENGVVLIFLREA